MNLIKNLSSEHEFTVLTPLRRAQKKVFDEATSICRIIPIWLPDSPTSRSRIYYQLNAWRQAFFDDQPRLVKTYTSPLIQWAVNQELEHQSYDLIQVQQLHMVQYLPHQVVRPSVLDIDNLWTKLIFRQASVPTLATDRDQIRFTQWFQTRLDLKKIPTYEKKALQRFDGLLAISPEEEQQVRNLAPHAKIAIVPNGVDSTYFSPEANQAGAALVPSYPCAQTSENGINPVSPILLFTGTMAYEPNADAVQYFAREILPVVRQKFPEVIFRIVGRDPLPEVQALTEDKNIQVTDFVEDVRPYMLESAIFVVPLRSGAGTRLKILEALAMKKAVVTTTLGAEGLNVCHAEHLLIADEPVDFANRVVELLSQPSLAQKLGENGRRLVKAEYDWKQIATRLRQLYEDLSHR